MRDYADRRGWAIAIEVKEVGSGASLRELREKLLEAARRGDIDVVVVWRLDRWGAAAVRRIPGVSFRIRSVWDSRSTDVRLKKRIGRTLIGEIIADVDAEAGEIILVIHCAS